MPIVIGLLFIATIVIVVAVCGARHNELFLVSIRRGRALVVRGRLPAGLLGDFADVVADARVRRGTIRAVKTETHARLFVQGADDGVAQRLRNVFGLYPLSKLRAPSAPAGRNLGQLVGWSWLAWLLLPRDR